MARDSIGSVCVKEENDKEMVCACQECEEDGNNKKRFN